MIGLFGTLELGSRSLQNQRQGVEVTGHNIANADNPAYARQRLQIQTSHAISSSFGQQGTGATAVSISRLRNDLLDQQIRGEMSVSSFLETQQEALQYAQASFGQEVDRQSETAGAVAAAHSLSARLNDFFAGMSSLAAAPSSMEERQSVINKASQLASRFNATDDRLGSVQSQLNTSVSKGVEGANELLKEVARLNMQIRGVESAGGSPANDLRDLRDEKLGNLSKLLKADVAEQEDGTVNVSVGGAALVSGKDVVDHLEAYDDGTGRMMVRAQASATPLEINGGSIGGAISVRDNEIAGLRSDLDRMAGVLITEVNAIHRAGYNLNGGTGADLFTGTKASDIAVNAAITGSPALLQAASVSGAVGDNAVALELSRLADRKHGSLDNQTLSDMYGQVVGGVGQALSNVNSQVEEQTRLQGMLSSHKESVSGVSLDEEMTNMMKYQKAFEASARLISVVEEMLDTVMNMKR